MILAYSLGSAHAATVAAKPFAIGAGSLRDALDSFAAQSDVQLIYSPELAAGKRTRGVSGPLTPADALGKLLAGTGLTWQAINDTTFVLKSPPKVQATDAKLSVSRSVPMLTRTLDTVSVSGSLIGNASIQTATPTYTLTAADIRARGYNSIADALQNSVLATGSIEGPEFAGSFTQGAQAVSLFGLSPQFTLILIDGKPLADFGRLYNGTVTFTSVSNLPIAIVDHIDFMPGGASSIYGSQAIGGVINIVTLSHLEGGTVSVHTGDYSDGGGANQRLSFAFGHEVGKLRMVGAGEFDSQAPIWGYQRPLTLGSSSGPGGASLPSIQAAVTDFGSASTYTGSPLGYLDPPAGCATQLFGGSTVLVNSRNPQQPGQYCGSDRRYGYTTYSNQLRSYDLMLKLGYQASEHVRFYSDVMMNWQEQRWFPGGTYWVPDDYPQGGIEDATTGHLLYLEKNFAPEEMPGGATGQMYRQDDLLYQADIGVHGQWGDSGWNWDIYYLRSGDRTEVVEPVSIGTRIDGFFNGILGPVLGVDSATGLQLYHPNYPAFFSSITPAQYASFTQNANEFSNTWVNDTRATISHASLFALPGGDAGFAALLEGGNEAWYEPVNPLFTQGDVFEHAETGGGGRRAHAAAAFELNLPLWTSLTMDLSGRYDYYALNQGSDNHKFTYKAGIEYRPLRSLLFRGNYTTAFKVPDLSSIYLGPTDYYTEVTDYYQCMLAHSGNCAGDYQYYVRGVSLANPRLQPTVAQSWSLGSVWSPTDKLSVSVDYLHLAIQDEVVEQSLDTLLHTDAQCLLGRLDEDSAKCQAIVNPQTGQVQRAGMNGPISSVTTYYANLANETTKSIIGSMRYRFAPMHFGHVDVQIDYNDMLKHDYQLASGQAPIDQLANPAYSTEFKSIVSGSVSWNSPNNQWTASLYGHRYGPSPNYIAQNEGAGAPGARRLAPWITFNSSISYRPTRRLQLSLLINNIANKMPPSDPTYTVYPYFNYENYNVYGREVMLQADLRFGETAH